MYNSIPKPPPHFPLNENRDWARFSVKRKYQTKITQTCHCTVPHGKLPTETDSAQPASRVLHF